MGMVIKKAAVWHVSAASERVIKTAWGVMGDRHAVVVGLENGDGLWGYGESWVNFPVWSPWERVAAFERGYIPYLKGREVGEVGTFMKEMGRAFMGPAVQAGAVGSLIAELCGVELALWDLTAKAKGVGMNRLWFREPAKEVRVYASGINSPLPWKDIDAMLEAGVKLFKLKLGFGVEDLVNLEALQRHLGDKGEVAVDVNRGWSAEEAMQWMPVLKERRVKWLEEPLRPAEEVQYGKLRKAGGVALAGGENVWVRPGCCAGDMAEFGVDILQPDVTKNCGMGAAVELIGLARGKGKRVVPHYLGSAVGQAASVQLASGCEEALVEWDINPNPLRTGLLKGGFGIKDGKIRVPEAAGMGWELDMKAMEKFKRAG